MWQVIISFVWNYIQQIQCTCIQIDNWNGMSLHAFTIFRDKERQLHNDVVTMGNMMLIIIKNWFLTWIFCMSAFLASSEKWEKGWKNTVQITAKKIINFPNQLHRIEDLWWCSKRLINSICCTQFAQFCSQFQPYRTITLGSALWCTGDTQWWVCVSLVRFPIHWQSFGVTNA